MVVQFYSSHVEIYTAKFENEPNIPELTDQNRMTIPPQLMLVTLTDKNGIQSGDHVTISKEITSLPDNIYNSFTVFPTLVQDFLTIKNYNLSNKATVRIVNATGKTTENVNMNSTNSLQINMSGYQPGIYVVQINDNKYTRIYKIIKQ